MIERRYGAYHRLNPGHLPRNRGMKLLYLPTYSPDFNPIEEAFSCIKAWIRGNRDYVRSELVPDDLDTTINPYAMIWDAVFGAVTPAKVEGWFKDCGYL